MSRPVRIKRKITPAEAADKVAGTKAPAQDADEMSNLDMLAAIKTIVNLLQDRYQPEVLAEVGPEIKDAYESLRSAPVTLDLLELEDE